jgi:hypothetical protein
MVTEITARGASLEITPRVKQKEPRFSFRLRFYHFPNTPLLQPLLDQSDQSARYDFICYSQGW